MINQFSCVITLVITQLFIFSALSRGQISLSSQTNYNFSTCAEDMNEFDFVVAQSAEVNFLGRNPITVDSNNYTFLFMVHSDTRVKEILLSAPNSIDYQAIIDAQLLSEDSLLVLFNNALCLFINSRMVTRYPIQANAFESIFQHGQKIFLFNYNTSIYTDYNDGSKLTISTYDIKSKSIESRVVISSMLSFLVPFNTSKPYVIQDQNLLTISKEGTHILSFNLVKSTIRRIPIVNDKIIYMNQQTIRHFQKDKKTFDILDDFYAQDFVIIAPIMLHDSIYLLFRDRTHRKKIGLWCFSPINNNPNDHHLLAYYPKKNVKAGRKFFPATHSPHYVINGQDILSINLYPTYENCQKNKPNFFRLLFPSSYLRYLGVSGQRISLSTKESL